MNVYLGYFLMLQQHPLELNFLFIIHLKVSKLKNAFPAHDPRP